MIPSTPWGLNLDPIGKDVRCFGQLGRVNGVGASRKTKRLHFRPLSPILKDMELTQLSAAQLRQAADIKEQITKLEGELGAILGTSTTTARSSKVHWTRTTAGRAKLARAARKSWHSGRRLAGGTKSSASSNGKKTHWTQTPAGRARMAKLMEQRWKTKKAA